MIDEVDDEDVEEVEEVRVEIPDAEEDPGDEADLW